MICVHCGEEIFETEDGLLVHADETFDHIARPEKFQNRPRPLPAEEN